MKRYKKTLGRHKDFLTHDRPGGVKVGCPALSAIADHFGAVSDVMMAVWSVEDFEEALWIAQARAGVTKCSCTAMASWRAAVCRVLEELPRWDHL